MSSNLGYRPSGDLRSGDLRSGDLSGTLTPPPNVPPNTPNINFNGVVDTVKDKASDLNLAGGAAFAGGAAAAAALGKGIYDSTHASPQGEAPQIGRPPAAPNSKPQISTSPIL
ncbi:MAG: hypothetical protein HC778_08040 [Chamaesiphon sp. CSU_1_12]|nr:hypothetical protein [Chamaesiphon sp. CSU_1_12]